MPSCVYVRRATLDLIGPFDEELLCSQAAVLDFALRARRRGLANLLADDVLVPTAAVNLPEEDSSKLTTRYPALVEAAAQPPSAALERTIALADVYLERMEVTFDARALGPETAGTQVYLLGLLEALAADRRSSLRVLVGPTLQDATRRRLESLPGVGLMSYEQALTAQSTSHVVHRPQQVFSPEDLLLLRPLGKRLVITHQDLIAYHNPMYFEDSELWQRYVRTTRQSLAAADHVIFFSHHALNDSLREDLVDPSRTGVVHLGVDLATKDGPGGSRSESEPIAPSSVQRLGGRPFLLCLGADYLHKNRPFALALLDELRRTHGWDGAIVLAGSHVEHGSSRADERELRARRSIRDDDVVEISTLSEAEREWLMQHASAVVYPTVQEGFGLLPFEAAHFAIPCLFAAQSSLAELLEEELATIVPWDAVRTSARAMPLLRDGPERERHVAGLRRAAGVLRWSDCAQGTVEAYRKALEAPYRASGEDAWQALEREREIVRLDQGATELGARLRQLSDELGEDAVALVGQHALLSGSDQHIVVAVAARPKLKRLVFGILKAGFRIMQALARWRRRA
jgi:glycosyltransferase involved in cell wall biosynthesis